MTKALNAYKNQLDASKCYSQAIFILRLVVGIAFMFHGWSKIQSPMDWMGPEAPVPGILQALAAISEFGGGLAWVLGLLFPLASLGIFFTMAFAVMTHVSMGHPFVGQGGSYELALVYLTLAAFMIMCGPGKFSADKYLFKK